MLATTPVFLRFDPVCFLINCFFAAFYVLLYHEPTPRPIYALMLTNHVMFLTAGRLLVLSYRQEKAER